MHCPNCGTNASAGQKFCRACGFGLEKVEHLITDYQSTTTDQTTGATGGLSDVRVRKLEKWAVRALVALGGFLGGSMIWAIIAKVMIEKGNIFEGIVILMIMAGAALVSLLAYLDSVRKKSSSNRSNQQQRMPQAVETAKMLSEPNAEMAASVTEQTTTRLEEKLESRM
jgi:hypothetical protein